MESDQNSTNPLSHLIGSQVVRKLPRKVPVDNLIINYMNIVQASGRGGKEPGPRTIEIDGLGTVVKYRVTYPDGHVEHQWSITFKESEDEN